MELTGDTILIVDDNPDDRRLIALVLKRIAPHLIIRYAVSGEEAIAYMNGDGSYADRTRFSYPAFIITDRAMDKGDGFSVLGAIQRTPLAGRVPVMMLSDWTEPGDIRRAYALGARSYCLKPSDLASLSAILLAFLNGRVSDQTGCESLEGSLRRHNTDAIINNQ